MKDVSRVADAFAAQCWPTKTLVVVDPVSEPFWDCNGCHTEGWSFGDEIDSSRPP